MKISNNKPKQILRFFDRLKRQPNFIFGLVGWTFFSIFFWLFEFVRPVRIVIVRIDRIGHLALEPTVHLHAVTTGELMSNYRFIYFTHQIKKVSNKYLLSLWCQKLSIHIVNNQIIRSILEASRGSRFQQNIDLSTSYYKPLTYTPVLLRHTEDGLRIGERFLRDHGIEDKDWFVCIHNRSSIYLKDHLPEKNSDYHDYRDCCIENFHKAVENITSVGGYVIRMGSSSEPPIEWNLDRFIDYTQAKQKPELDIFLSSKCRFFIGSSSGLICVPLIFKRPIAMTNLVPLAFAGSARESVFTPKLFRSKQTGKFIPFSQLQEMGFFIHNEHAHRAEYYASVGVEPVENAASDLGDVALDMLDIVENRTPPNYDDVQELRRAYKEFFPTDSPARSEFAGQLSARFALRHQSLITSVVKDQCL